jgi:hypothetical protein
MLLQTRAKTPVKSPRYEWFEDDFIQRWATSTNAVTAGATSFDVDDGTKFTVGDVWTAPAATASSTFPEQMLITGIAGNTITVTRGFAGTTAAALSAGDSLFFIEPSFQEGFAVPNPRYTKPVVKTTYTTLFSHVYAITKTANASQMYGSDGKSDRTFNHFKLMEDMKISLNNSLIWSKASEDLTGSDARRTTMGLNSVITSNVTNAGGTLTQATFEAWARSVFRYSSSKPKVLLACPMLISALNSWANSKLYLEPEESVYGVNLRRFNTGHGTFLLVRDWSLRDGIAGKNGFAGWAFAVDMDSVEVIYLKNNGENRDIQIIFNATMDGADRYVDQAIAEMGFCVKHEKRHGKMYNITGWA